MICNKFSELSPFEKILFIGEITHSTMNDDDLFKMGQELIELAKEKGLFNNVKIMPDNDDTEN